MYTFIALYKKPDDVPAFLEHYEAVHAPLAKKVPGLHKLVVKRITGNPFGGPAPYFLLAEMQFASREDFDNAMRSEENKATGRDAMTFAGELITPMLAETWEV